MFLNGLIRRKLNLDAALAAGELPREARQTVFEKQHAFYETSQRQSRSAKRRTKSPYHCRRGRKRGCIYEMG
jgi:hypothetical protein